jgi:hypothetical protein
MGRSCSASRSACAILDEHAPLRRLRVAAEREHAAHLERRGEHPLSHGDVGQYVVDQVRRGGTGAARSAARARRAAFAGERHRHLVPARRAHDAQESIGEDAATKVAVKLLLDVARQALAVLLPEHPEERRKVLA